MGLPDHRVLVTIPISHFCEKARWALERAGLEYEERRHIQIVHQIAARRAGGGKTAPVLATPDGVYAESRAIMQYADEHLPATARLYPADQLGRRTCSRSRTASIRSSGSRDGAGCTTRSSRTRSPSPVQPHRRAGLGAAGVPARARAGEALHQPLPRHRRRDGRPRAASAWTRSSTRSAS